MTNDHPPVITEAQRIQIEVYRAMTPGQKLELAAGLRATWWEFKAAGIREEHPEWEELEVQRRVREIVHLGGL